MREIYYHEIEISYKKAKSFIKDNTWAVSLFKTPIEIMKYDKKTMDRLTRKYYGTKYKSQKQLVITKILSTKSVGSGSNQKHEEVLKKN